MKKAASTGRQQTFLQQLQTQSLAQFMQQTEQEIRQNPTRVELRNVLFQLCCLSGDWLRALKQLQVASQLVPSQPNSHAQVYRALIRCELFRASCFNGEHRPGFILTPPPWLTTLLDAVTKNLQGKEDEADVLRSEALESAPETSGQLKPGNTFRWISDSDSWSGPTVEAVIGGVYTWLPFCQIKQIQSAPPQTVTDLLWKPTSFVLADDSAHSGFLFARYQGSESMVDALRLCRETHWTEHGQTSVRGLGQKTWQTDQGDYGILELTHCAFGNNV